MATATSVSVAGNGCRRPEGLRGSGTISNASHNEIRAADSVPSLAMTDIILVNHSFERPCTCDRGA